MVALLFTVAVGPDRPRGEVPARVSLRGAAQAPALGRLCERFAVRPTWLLTWPVVHRPEGQYFGDAWDRGACEVGVCLEPWNTPPFEANEDRLVPHPPSAVPASAVQAKLETLTTSVEARFGQAPRCHKAAGGGLDGPALQALERRGYLADLSVLPLFDGRHEGGVDWRTAPAVPYFPDRQRPGRRGSSPVLEIPVTSGFDQSMPQSVARTLIKVPGLASGLIDRVARSVSAPVPRLVTLDPAVTDLGAMQRLAEAAIQRAAPCLHLTVRLEALTPGCSGTCPDAEAAGVTRDRIEGFLRFAVDSLRAEPMTVGAFVERHLAFDGAGKGPAPTG